MKNYKECTIEDFNISMKEKDYELKKISNEHLYILYTKFKEEAATCFCVGTNYSRDFGHRSEKRANMYKEELQNRGITVL